MRTLLPVAVGLAACAVLVAGAQPPETQSAALSDEQTLERGSLLKQVPTSAQEIDARLQLAQEQLDTLRPTTQPTSAPADEAGQELLAARRALCEEWEAYASQLQQIAALQQKAVTLASEEHIRELTQQIEELRRLTGRWRQPPPADASAADIAESGDQLKKLEGRHAALSELQARRATQLATGFKQQRDNLEAELKQLRQARQESQQAADAAPSTVPGRQELALLRSRRGDVQIARYELALQALTLTVGQTELMQKQDERLLEALGTGVTALQARVAALSEAESRNTLETIDARRRQATQPCERAFLDLQHFAQSALAHYFGSQELLGKLKSRYPQSEFDRLRERVASSRAVWNDVVGVGEFGQPAGAAAAATPAATTPAGESAETDQTRAAAQSAAVTARFDPLAYRTGREVLRLRWEARRECASFAGELAALRQKLGASVSELHDLRTARDRVREHARQLAGLALTAAESLPAADRTRSETDVIGVQSELDNAMKSTIADAEHVGGRLHEAVALVETHLLRLAAAEDALYWTALKRRESGIIGLDWPAIRGELRQVLGTQSQTTTAPTDGEPQLARILDGSETRRKLGNPLRAACDDLAAVNVRGWMLAIVLLVVAGVVAALFRRHAKRSADAIRRQLTALDDEGTRHFAQRAHLLIWRLGRDMSIPLAVTLPLWLGARAGALPERTLLPAEALVTVVLGAYVLLRFVRRLFDPVEQQRVVPCCDAVAKHYRYWSVRLSLLAIILLPVYTALGTANILPGIRGAIWEVFKTGTLVLLVGFLLRRDRVVGRRRTARDSWLAILIAAAYPFVFATALALLILELIGYGVLVEFLGTGLLASAATLALTVALVEYLCDVLDQLGKPSRGTCPGEPREATPGTHVPRLSKSLLRLAGAIAAVTLIVLIWGGGGYLHWLTWKTAALLGLTVVAGLVVDRVMYSALHALEVSGRLPEITTRIVRRWLRGLLTVVVLLLVITLAGAKTDRLWAPLSALFAMVAIGFVAVWSMLSSILATFIILIWRPFNVGERIELQPDNISGKVVDINFMYTLLSSDSGTRIAVPNAMFVQRFIRRQKLATEPERTLAEQLEADKPVGE